jgi:hypothetical protein
MVNVKAPGKPPTKALPVVVTPALVRTITELMAVRREFNRSQLFRTAVIEMADRDLPEGWRATVGLDREESAA